MFLNQPLSVVVLMFSYKYDNYITITIIITCDCSRENIL